MRKFQRVVSILIITVMVLCIAACSDKSAQLSSDVDDYLGDYDYYDTPAALVYEQVEGEEDGFYGIQYRRVEDFGGLCTQDKIAVCLFFYSSMSNQAASITAGVEDLAQTLTGKVLFVAVDVASHEDISSAYGITVCPEFILLNNSARISTFESESREYWTIDDVANWIADNGFEPDYSLLN